MNEARLPLIVVTGDIVLDCHLYGGVKTAATSFSEPGTVYEQQDGGAALTHKLLEAGALAEVVAPAQSKVDAAEKELARATERTLKGKAKAGELDAAVVTLRNAIANVAAAQAEGSKWAVELGGLSLPKDLPAQLRSYGVWTARPARKGAQEQVWRVERHFGYGPTESINTVGALEARSSSGSAVLTVIDDGAILFRHRRSTNAWPALSGASHYLLKMSTPLCQGDLWAALAAPAVRDRLIVVVSVSDVRREDAQISHRLSWEKSAQDTLRVLQEDPIARQLGAAAHVVVTFGAEGALWFRRGKDGGFSARLTFSPYEQEGDHARHIEGTAYGFGTCFIAGIAHELMRSHVDAKTSEENPFCNPEAMAQALQQGIVGGIRARRLLLELGHGAVDSKKPGFPATKLGEELACPGGGFASVDVPSASCAPAGCQWSILQQSEGTESSPIALMGLASLVARFGPAALSHVPALRLGSVFTVDRSEIESLRTLETLIRAYEATPVQKKPLSIGVFGPPGAGKSFAVKALAKAILGEKAPFLEFNLSQFKSPDELIGAFHRVRDAVLQGITPVAFWDEFDSQSYKWLQYLLAPMQDGAFQEGQITHPIGKCVFVFAGGTSATCAMFGPPTLAANAIDEQRVAHQRAQQDFKLLKGPDFLSRLHGHLDVLGPNARNHAECPDITWPIRRALLLRALLGLKDSDELAMDPGLLNALLAVPQYEHGARSFEKIVRALVQGSVDGRLQRSALPPEPLLDRDTNAAKFYKLMQERDVFRNHPDIERLAAAAHEHYRKTTSGLKAELDKAYTELDPDYQAANRATAQRIPDHLALIDFAIEPEPDNDDHAWRTTLETALEQHIERLAQAEHLGWCQERRANGWIHAEVRDNQLKHHPSLVEWSRLSESDRDKDRENIRTIPELLELAKYKAIHRGVDH